MCDDNDMEGVRLWFYGGTPPLDDASVDEHQTHMSPNHGWNWLTQPDQPAADPLPELAAA